jgi:FkbM family methyltransferase
LKDDLGSTANRISEMKSWTLDFFKEWSSRMDLLSVARFRKGVLREAAGEQRPGRTLVLGMKRPFRGPITLREWGTDYRTFNEIVLDEVYKPVVTQVSSPATIIDLGANVGLASLYFASHWPSCRILAVEPNPETYQLLSINLAPLVRAERCKTLQAAVWDADVLLSPAPNQVPGAFDMYSLCDAEFENDTGPKVRGLSIVEIIQRSRFKNVDLLKIDIEGAEARLFRGNTDWLQRVGNVAIEFHCNARRLSNFDEVMKQYGFRSQKEERHTVLFSKGSEVPTGLAVYPGWK